ncbi:Homeobox protein KNOX3 [Hordeum vulgare]|nr:Homeobox protein KNOX3 [Hordeum vulgare]
MLPPDDEAVVNGFGRPHLHESEACLLYEADYPTSPAMLVTSSWRLSAGGVPMPPTSSGDDRRVEIARIWSSLPEASRNLPRYAPDSNTLFMAYFKHCHTNQLAATNGADSRGRFNSEGRQLWWGIPDRTLEAVLEHIKGDNSLLLEYPTPPSFSRCRDISLTSRCMEAAPSSSSGSRSRSSGSPTLLPVKTEPLENPLGWRTPNGDIVINEGGSSSRHVKPKTELALLPVYLDMAAADETALKWAWDDYVRAQTERQRHALE